MGWWCLKQNHDNFIAGRFYFLVVTISFPINSRLKLRSKRSFRMWNCVQCVGAWESVILWFWQICAIIGAHKNQYAEPSGDYCNALFDIGTYFRRVFIFFLFSVYHWRNLNAGFSFSINLPRIFLCVTFLWIECHYNFDRIFYFSTLYSTFSMLFDCGYRKILARIFA